MKYILKFTAQLIAFILIMMFWFYPYLIWNAKKHEDHNDIIEDFSYCYERFKRRFVKPRNAL